MAALIITTSGIADVGPGCDEAPTREEAALQSGFVPLGDATGPVGLGWYDTSFGEGYGNGRRYEHEETSFITKVPSKRRSNNQ
jgi:hypothetical protein